jgi:MFS family permease
MLVRIALFAALGGFLFGLDLGLIGGAMLGISRSLSIESDAVKEAIVGAAKLGAVAGTFLGGALMLRYGRRPAIALQAVFFTAGPMLMASARGVGCVAARAPPGACFFLRRTCTFARGAQKCTH